jgi:predicted RNase H-like nuclease (RuvC/YqgF family)
MDYLLSLVGKDQDTIVDAIKDLAENAEKVKAQELEIKELITNLDEDKEEQHYLKNKLDQKYDMIDDM